MRSLVSCFLVAVCVISTTSAFAPQPLATKTTTRARVDPLSALSPEHVDAFSAAADHWHHVVASSSSILADAADAAAAEAAQQDAGWWKQYLNIFKQALLFVHSSVDGPLRSMGVTQTWGISIFLFTAAVRSLLVPLSVQQSKSAEYMKALKPYVAEIKEKFKNQDAQNRAIAKLYEDAKQNPLAGCLVSLAQLPIFLGLYRGVRLLAMDGKLDEPFLWIPSLEGPVSAPDYRGMEWLTEGWTTIDGTLTPALGWETTLAFLIMPVILVVGQSVTMKALQPAEDDDMSEEEKEQMEKTQGFLKFLPLLIGFFSLQVPAGLTIYWFTSNLFTLSQSLAVRAYYAANPPQIELPDYWDALDDVDSMSPEERRKAAEAGLAGAGGPTFDELKDEAMFHYVVQRGPLRAESDAWKRVEESSSRTVPTEMMSWVGTTTASHSGSAAESAKIETSESETESVETASA